MSGILSKIASSVQLLFQKAEDLIEEEREFSVSQNLLNATFQKYVTDNVDLLQDLHADLYDDWLRLYAIVDVAGIYASLSVDLKLIQMEMNPEKQLIVFERISETQIIESRFDGKLKQMAVNFALFFMRKVLKKDPLGPILQHYDVLEEKHGLLYLDLNRWLGDNATTMNALRKLHINHAEIKSTRLMLQANVNLEGLLNRDKKDDDLDDFEDEESIAKNTVSPIED